MHTEENIDQVVQVLPGKLSSLTGALKIHQLVVSKDGSMSTKQMPAEQAKPFRITVTVRRAAAATAPVQETDETVG